MTTLIWMTIAVVYLVFRRWYDGSGKPMAQDEVESLLNIVGERNKSGLPAQDLVVLRKFLETDNGKEFLMVNLVRFEDSPVTHPDTGKPVESTALLQDYFKPLMSSLLPRAGHPVLTSQVVGGYLDSMDAPENPGWHVAGYIRYRSRRDAMVATITNPAFDEIYKLKVAALKQTFAIPTLTHQALYLSPRVSVAMGLVIIGLVLQIFLG